MIRTILLSGGEKKLTEAVLTAEKRYHPKMIFVVTSCASGIIGDDVDAIIINLQKEVNAILIPIYCEGFKSKICASGFDAFFMALSKYILKGKTAEKQKGLINLFAPVSISYMDQLEIERMLGKIGLRVNYIPFYSNYDNIISIT